jgi:phage terminase large subunit-like protein
MLRTAAIRNPHRRFPSPPRHVLVARLDRAASLFGFHVETVTLRRPLQLAPLIVIESRHYLALAHALPRILDRIDPPPRSNNRVYEGIFIEAVDEHHVPFVIAFDSLRGQIAGGQWARSKPLFPYAHG